MFVAIDRGYFQELGLDVQVTPVSAGTELLPLLAASQIDLGAAARALGPYSTP